MKLLIIMPCYNEEQVLRETEKQISPVLEKLVINGKITEWGLVFVDDGSKDSTWSIIEQLNHNNAKVSGIKLAHNVGHQNALWAGYEQAIGKCDCVISMDADLQHDINSIESVVDKYIEGYEVVYGVRNDRTTDSWLKKKTALVFYKLMTNLGVDIIPNHADYRLLSNRVAEALVSYPERNIFIRGLVRTLGFKETEVKFDVKDRFAGESKYTMKKMLNFALDGITSFSVQPLRIITAIGLLFVFISIIEMIYALISFFAGSTIIGWTSLLISVWLIGGLLLLSVGVIGEYIGKIYKEVKHRPRYLIEKTI